MELEKPGMKMRHQR